RSAARLGPWPRRRGGRTRLLTDRDLRPDASRQISYTLSRGRVLDDFLSHRGAEDPRDRVDLARLLGGQAGHLEGLGGERGRGQQAPQDAAETAARPAPRPPRWRCRYAVAGLPAGRPDPRRQAGATARLRSRRISRR